MLEGFLLGLAFIIGYVIPMTVNMWTCLYEMNGERMEAGDVITFLLLVFTPLLNIVIMAMIIAECLPRYRE